MSLVLLPSAARIATVSTASIKNRGKFRGVAVYISATASAATPSVVAVIEGYDAASATWYPILTAAAITGASTKRLIVYPGVTVVANLSVSEALPAVWRVTLTHADADSITYSVGASLLV